MLDGDRKKFNLYEPTKIKPKDGDPSTFIEFMQHLIPIKKDREYLLRWIATLIAKPEVRITYSVLLTSETHGRGKTTLADAILRPLVGEDNTSFPNEEQMASRFNGWVAERRLAVVNEIHHGRSKKVYDCIKNIVSDASIDIERKGKGFFYD